MDVLQWARANGCLWDAPSCCSGAARGGHLPVLQWARANGCPWGQWTCAAAAEGGHLHVLQWARAKGCPWTASTCAGAARAGRLPILQWAHGSGCPWNEATCAIAGMAIWMCCNGLVPMASSGMRPHAGAHGITRRCRSRIPKRLGHEQEGNWARANAAAPRFREYARNYGVVSLIH
jgi:hypothetical protein